MAHGTAWHTVGPFFPRTFFQEGVNDLASAGPGTPAAFGIPIALLGTVRQDGGGPAVNAVIEAWQADAAGRFAHPEDPDARSADWGFFGWGRAWTDSAGRYNFRTVLPGGYDDPIGRRAPHINLSIYASGIMRRLNTAVFFPGVPENATDPVLACVPHNRRPLLVAKPHEPDENDRLVFTFDIILRGEQETPFFID